MKYFAQVFFAGLCIVLSFCVTTANSPEAHEIVSLQKFMEQNGARVIDLKKLETGHEMLSVEINGIAGNFILDSGAGATVLHEKLISKYQLNADAGSSTAQASGAGGEADITSYEISSFKLEGYSFKLDRINTLDLTSVVRSLKAATGV
ncbi:MAG: retropepsin-like aspartic protease, partial [Gammaproteobacteria bacterium]